MKQSFVLEPKVPAKQHSPLCALNQWLSAESKTFSEVLEEPVSRKFVLCMGNNVFSFMLLCLTAEINPLICLFCFALFALSLYISKRTYQQMRTL